LARFRDRDRVVFRDEVVAQDDELVAPEPPPPCRPAAVLRAAAGERHEQTVTRAVPRLSLTTFEVVDVGEEHRDGSVGAAGARQRELEPVEEDHAVRQPGEGSCVAWYSRRCSNALRSLMSRVTDETNSMCPSAS